MRVLLVEDQHELRDQLQRTLQAIPGVRVVLACATAREALEWLAEHSESWDLALVDIFLYEGNGFDVLRRCKQRAGWQKVAVMSNYSREPVREYALQAGADAFFDKARELDALLGFCMSHAESFRAQGSRAGKRRPTVDLQPREPT